VPNSEIGRLITARHREIREAIQAAIEAGGYTDFKLAHQAVFAALPPEGSRIGQLGRRAHLAKQTMTELIGDLVAHGYLERVRDPLDGRAQLVRPTARGAAVDRVAQEAIKRVERRWRRRLGAEKLAALTSALVALDES
jgi:DNA-binding MarR family transcriptional regulator